MSGALNEGDEALQRGLAGLLKAPERAILKLSCCASLFQESHDAEAAEDSLQCYCFGGNFSKTPFQAKLEPTSPAEEATCQAQHGYGSLPGSIPEILGMKGLLWTRRTSISMVRGSTHFCRQNWLRPSQ